MDAEVALFLFCLLPVPPMCNNVWWGKLQVSHKVGEGHAEVGWEVWKHFLHARACFIISNRALTSFGLAGHCKLVWVDFLQKRHTGADVWARKELDVEGPVRGRSCCWRVLRC